MASQLCLIPDWWRCKARTKILSELRFSEYIHFIARMDITPWKCPPRHRFLRRRCFLALVLCRATRHAKCDMCEIWLQRGAVGAQARLGAAFLIHSTCTHAAFVCSSGSPTVLIQRQILLDENITATAKIEPLVKYYIDVYFYNYIITALVYNVLPN